MESEVRVLAGRIAEEEEGLVIGDEKVTNGLVLAVWECCKKSGYAPLQAAVGRKIRKVVSKDVGMGELLHEGNIGKTASRLKAEIGKKKKKRWEQFRIRKVRVDENEMPKKKKIKVEIHPKPGREGECRDVEQKKLAKRRLDELYQQNVCLKRKVARRERLLAKTPSGRRRRCPTSPYKLSSPSKRNGNFGGAKYKEIGQLRAKLSVVTVEKELASRCCTQLRSDLEATKERVKKLARENRELEQSVAYMEDLLQAEKSMYVDGCRRISTDGVLMVMSLIDYGVASEKVKPVIQAVSEFCGVTVRNLPSSFAVNSIRKRQLQLAQANIEEIQHATNTTMYTDETRRAGRCLMAYAISTETDMKLIGVKELPSKSAQDTLDGLVYCLQQVSTSVGDPELGNKLIVALKNTQSDQASTEKLFGTLLKEYRFNLLPKIMANWENLNDEERDQHGEMYHFFCGLHLLIAFAEVFNKELAEYEQQQQKTVGAEKDDALKKYVKKSESSGIRFVRTAAKLFAPGSEDKYGTHSSFARHLRESEDEVTNKLVDFRRNRFNIVFLDGKYCFYLADKIVSYIEDVGTTNPLLEAVLADGKSSWCQAGARALGLLEQNVMAPLWRVLEDRKVSISDMETYYTGLATFFADVRKEGNLQKFVNGNLKPGVFSEKVTNDQYLEKLTRATDLDEETIEILDNVFRGLEESIRHLAAQHIDDGEHTKMSESKKAETASVRKHNKICEEVFGHYDRMMRAMPNASPMTIEAMLLYKKNGVGHWLRGKDKDTRDRLIEDSRKKSKVLVREEKVRGQEIEEMKRENLRQKIRDEAKRKQRVFERRTKIMTEMVHFGLWQTEAQVLAEVGACPTKTLKLEAIKAQLRFRKTVLGQPAESKALYQFSKSGKQFTVEELTRNLIVLVKKSLEISTAGEQSYLIGLLVRQRFKTDGEELWWSGRVISTVPGYPTWHNIKYEGDPSVYTGELLKELEAGDLEVLADQPSLQRLATRCCAEFPLQFCPRAACVMLKARLLV